METIMAAPLAVHEQDNRDCRPAPPPAPAAFHSSSFRDAMHRFLVANLHQGLTLQDLSQVIGYSEKYCSEWFFARMGESFSSYVKRLRVERATSLLSSPQRLADIAEALGFQDQYAFSHFFKKATGISPQGYRQQTGRRRCRPSPSHHRRRSTRRESETVHGVPA
jgi:AraC-like DNA-binding protein